MRLAMVGSGAFPILERISIAAVSVFRCSCKFSDYIGE